MARRQNWLLVCAMFILLFTINSLQAQDETSSAAVVLPGAMSTSVSTYDGNLTHRQTLFEIADAQNPFRLELTYNSYDSKLNLGYGFGWQLNTNLFYVWDGEDILIYYGDRHVERFRREGDGRFTSPRGVTQTLEEYEPSRYRLNLPDGSFYTFDQPLHQHANYLYLSNHKAITFIWNDDGAENGGWRLRALNFADNQQLRFEYSAYDEPGGTRVYRLDRVLDSGAAAGSGFTLSYDENNQLTALPNAAGHTFSYVYADGLLTQITDPRSNHVTFTYTGSQVTQIATDNTTRSIAYAPGLTVVGDVVQQGDQTLLRRNLYDDHGLLLLTDDGQCTIGAKWDANGRLLSFGSVSADTQVSYEYDNFGNLTAIHYPGNLTAALSYAPSSNLLSGFQSAAGSQYSYQYEALTGNPNQLTPGDGSIAVLAYDEMGRISSATLPGDATTTYRYSDNTVSRTDPDGGVTQQVFDAQSGLSARRARVGWSRATHMT